MLVFARARRFSGIATSVSARKPPHRSVLERCATLIATTDGARPKDVRDRAILLLLTIYALRSGEVRTLKLEDLDWEKGLLFVPRNKGRKREPYPLSPTVGQAIIRYLKEGRPCSSYREIFLTVEAPIQPLRRSSLGTIVAKRTLSLDPPLELADRMRFDTPVLHICWRKGSR